MNTFADSYTPILGPTGFQAITVDTTANATLTIPADCNAAWITALGDNILIKMNGENIASSLGQVVPLNESCLLTNLNMLRQLKIQAQNTSGTLAVTYLTGA
jgi:hypothetical protein